MEAPSQTPPQSIGHYLERLHPGASSDACTTGPNPSRDAPKRNLAHEAVHLRDNTGIARADDTVNVTLYGIKNCDTMKKARAWLDARGVVYGFHDYKTAGVDRALLERWCEQAGWEALLNRAGATFRKLADADKAGLDERKAIALMMAQPSMIKRPVLTRGQSLLVGFDPQAYARLLG